MTANKCPDRLSAYPDSPHFDPVWSLCAEVFVNNVLVSGVVELCISEGWAEHYVKGEHGRFIVEDDQFKRARVTGVVEVALKGHR